MTPQPDAVRLFVALELPEAVTAVLAAWSARVVGNETSLRRVGRDSLHVTLCFLGMRPVSEVGEIGEVIRTVSAPGVTPTGAPTSAVAAVFGEPVWLPRRRPRVLAVQLDPTGPDPSALAALQTRLATGLHQLGVYAAEDRPYLPHVTVARVRRPFPRTTPPVPPAPLDPLPFTADRVTLFRSRLGDGPARYEALETVRLG